MGKEHRFFHHLVKERFIQTAPRSVRPNVDCLLLAYFPLPDGTYRDERLLCEVDAQSVDDDRPRPP